MKPPPFAYHAPRTLGEALAALAEAGPDGKVLAGGQSLIPMLNMRLAAPAALVDINRIDELRTLSADRRGVRNSITPPAVKALAHDLIAEAAAKDPHAIVVYDVPLLVEAGVNGDNPFDLIVVVHASHETRIKRLIELRGMTRQEAVHRLNSQATDTERLALADLVIDNDGSLTDTLAQVDRLWERVSDPAA